MTESLPRIQRHITTATGMPTRLNRPDVAPADSAEGRAGVESAVAETPILITEQEVLLSTAAAVTVPGTKIATKRRHYPHHYVFLEQALMAREMERC
jgi:hypothetical protein